MKLLGGSADGLVIWKINRSMNIFRYYKYFEHWKSTKHHSSIKFPYNERFCSLEAFHLRTLEHERSVSMVFSLAHFYTRVHILTRLQRKATSAFVFQDRRSMHPIIWNTTQRNVLYAYTTHFKHARTLNSFSNGIFGYASLVVCADKPIEQRACQTHTSAPQLSLSLHEVVSASNSVEIGVRNLMF